MTRRAFTLIELLVVIAIIAILAAILFPVFAQAKKSAKTTSTLAQIKQIGLGNHMYGADADDMTVITDSGPNYRRPIWGELVMPYVKSKAMFWDPTRPTLQTETLKIPGDPMEYHWTHLTTIAINDTGFAGYYTTSNGACNGTRQTYTYGRSMAGMEDISKRVAFVPNVWGGTSVGWYYVRAYQANWIDPGNTKGGWSWYNMVWDTREFYSGNQIPVARADGSASKLRRSDFIDWNQAPGTSQYCAWMNETGQKTWGAFWNSN